MGFLINPYNFAAAGGVGGWVELGRTTLGSANTDIAVTSLADNRYYMVLSNALGHSVSFDDSMRLNADTGSNYARRGAYNSNEFTGVNNSCMTWAVKSNSTTTPTFAVGYLSNYSTKEKLMISHGVIQYTAGAGTAPIRSEAVGKWANTSNRISAVTLTSAGAQTYNTGSEVVVLGWDAAATHTTNFWEELASVNLSTGAAAYINSGTITAKKYLWYQIFGSQTIDSDFLVTFNADTGANYARRYSNIGLSDATQVSLNNFPHTTSGTNKPMFYNAFVINNSANEKLIYASDLYDNTAGAGTAPGRLESVGKWANTSSQITSMRVTSGSGNLNTNTHLKIWGSN